MHALKNDRFIKALLGQPVDSTPVWMMRQAGRYLPEYRQLRAKAGDFLSLCRNAEFACEVTIQPLRRFQLDAAILFSDILTIPDALGQGLYFETGEGPKFKKVIRSEKDVSELPKVKAEIDLDYVMNAVRTIRSELGGKVPLIGFSGSPWTLATYMIEGGSSRDYRFSKTMLYQQPEVLHALLQHLTEITIDYLNQQILAGAQAVQIFDSWGGALAHREFIDFSQHYLQQIVQGLIKQHDGHRIPVIVFTKGGGQWLPSLANTGADALGVDWTTDLATARRQLQGKIAVQGNLDPGVLFGSAESIRAQVKLMLEDVYQDGHLTHYVANLGHGISQWVNPDHAKIFIDAVHDFSQDYFNP